MLEFLRHEDFVSIRHTYEELVRLFLGVVGIDSSHM